MDIKIEKNVPAPLHTGKGTPAKYPFAEMAVGDSFCLPADEACRLHGAAWHAGNRLGKKFTTRKTADGVRVWRIA